MNQTSERLENLKFRKANESDISSIVYIHNSQVISQQKSLSQGFLLAPIDRQSVLDALDRSKTYFVATRADDNIIGFVCVSQPKLSTEVLKKIQWIDSKFQKKLQDSRHISIQVVATHKQWSGKGVGQFMYRSLYQLFPHSYFSLFIVIKPIFNQKSMRFHLKQGFKKIGTIRVTQFLEFKNYQDALMFKEMQE